MKLIEEYNFNNKEVNKLPAWFTHSEFEKLIRVIEKLMNEANELNKAFSVFDERKMDSYLINLLAKFWGIPDNILTQQKLVDILVLKMGLIKPTTLTTLYLISSLFFSSESIYIQEENAEVYIHYAFGKLIQSATLVDEKGDFLIDNNNNNLVLAIEEDSFNAFSLLSKTLAAGIEYNFLEEKLVAATLVDEEENELVDELGNNYIVNLDNSVALQYSIKNILNNKM